ncbi:hypothetical protein [Streptomyces sp. M10]|nr:hypothetical protein [Streptomyces sp. M10]
MAKDTITLERGIYIYESVEIPRDKVSAQFLAAYEALFSYSYGERTCSAV